MSEKISTRVAYGNALAKSGDSTDIVVFDADLSICTMTCLFAERFPERFFNCGIAEENMVGMAAGMATTGKIVFCNSFASFSAGRAYDQVRNSVCYPGLNVKIVGTHAGLSVGEDGATHQCIEDLALMRVIPGMHVVCPCDANETEQAVKAIIAHQGPCYLRLGREPVADVTAKASGYSFELGKGALLREGGDVAIIAAGYMVQLALDAAALLYREGIEARVVDMHTIKPIDRDLIVQAAKDTGAIVTAEEHNVLGGLGAAVAEALSRSCPVPIEMVGIEDVFGRSGKADELMEYYGLTPERIYTSACRAIERKRHGSIPKTV